MSKHSKKKSTGLGAPKRVIIVLLTIIVALSAVVVVLIVNNATVRNSKEDMKSSYEAYISSLTANASSNVEHTSSNATPVSSEQAGSASSTTSGSNVSSVPDPDDWNLRVANSENVLPANFTVETGLITPAYARDKGMSFDARAVDDLNAMLAAANEDGVNLLVISCFRTLTKQTNLYNAEVQKWLNQGYSEADAKAKAGTIVAVPGTSDHNLGLAVDLNSVEQSFENTRQFTWLQEHAEEYGFVMRYPKHKQDITKIIYEPWHYRYVGVPAAKEMNERDMCLEEYVVYLRGLGR